MADGAFEWLWQNERMSDMELLITTTENLDKLPKRGEPEAQARAPAQEKQGEVQPRSQSDTKPGSDQTAATPGNTKEQVEVDASKDAGEHEKEEGAAKEGSASEKQASGLSDVSGINLEKAEADDGCEELDNMQGSRLQGNRTVLGTFSEYFRTRVTGWDDDPHTLRGKDGRPVLMVAVEPELTEAAHAVVRMMYNAVVRDGISGKELAQMCRVADMWGVPTCLQRCFNALSQLKEGKVDVDDLAEIYSWLPDSVTTLPSYSEWETQVQARVVQVFQDVYTLLTTHKLLQRFRSLPFQAVLAWAGSDKLVIDSENSVAVAISWWYGGEEGSQATEDQLEELSGALRLKHLSNAYRMTQLRLLPWFSYEKKELDWFCVAAANGMLDAGYEDCPPGWSKPPRQHVNTAAIDRRWRITWDVPKSELEQALSSQKYTELLSPAVYAAGSGWQLKVHMEKAEGSKPRGIGIYFKKCSYECQREEVAPENDVTQVKFTITHQPPAPSSRRTLMEGSPTLISGWGMPGTFKASGMSDLLPHLSDGHLKLGATFHVIH